MTKSCACGCGRGTDGTWAMGHDRTATALLIKLKYGDTLKFIERHGYGPGGRNLHQEGVEAGLKPKSAYNDP